MDNTGTETSGICSNHTFKNVLTGGFDELMQMRHMVTLPAFSKFLVEARVKKILAVWLN